MSSEQTQIPLGDDAEPDEAVAHTEIASHASHAEAQPEVAVSLSPVLTAGDLIREAREAQGMHAEALASALKVPTRKIEALESGDLDEMPDLAFTRALASAVCRYLKLDPAIVLALLPQLVAGQLPTPHMRDSLRNEDGQMGRVRTTSSIDSSTSFFKRPLWLAAAALLALAASVPFWPELRSSLNPTAAKQAGKNSTQETLVHGAEPTMRNAADPAAVAVSAPAVAAPVPVASATKDALPAAAAATALLLLRASGESWLQVTDASGRVLLSRTLSAGEAVPIEGKAPFRLIVGRAELVTIAYQGANQPYPTAMQTGLARLSVPAPAL